MRSSKGTRARGNLQKTAPTTVCYCNGKRELGSIEIVCTQCLKWFHGRCLKEYHELINNGVPFMICYSFVCKECRPQAEDWKAKKADLTQMCVTVFATLIAEKLKESGKLSVDHVPEEHTFLSLKQTVIPYMDENWYMLTSIKKKNVWHSNLSTTLLKEKNVFVQHEDNDDHFTLAEKNLALVGPLHEAVKQIGKKTTIERAEPREPRVVELPPIEGPKTRGATKRRVTEAPVPGKKQKLADYTSTVISGTTVDLPNNKDGYRYHLTEIDPHVADEGQQDDKVSYVIPNYQYRVVLPQTVQLSSNDRAYQVRMETVTGANGTLYSALGHEGYAMARATHGASKGTWYYEVTFEEQPDDSHIRIGWAQSSAPLQACTGYNKFSYSWRSKHGTKFHDAIGKSYSGEFKEGDTLGCLIHLPFDEKFPTSSSESFLPKSRKESPLISYKGNYFFEEHVDGVEAAKTLVELPGSYIEFFLNGKSCGKAFQNLYAGYYFPSVSLFHNAKIHVNLGPKYKYLPKGATGMHARAEEQIAEQAMSDMLYLLARSDEKEKAT